MSMERIKEAAEQVAGRIEATKGRGEQATKISLIMPMIAALGYDILNPLEVCPEYDADFAIKKGGQKEKVDFAILQDGKPVVFIEAKPSDMSLDGHQGQLARYFNSVNSVSLGILTNGIEWRFFTDTAEKNMMDAVPFHVARLDGVADQGLDVVARFIKGQPFVDTVRDYATDLLYTEKIAAFLRNEIDLKDREPSEYFIRWILKGNDSSGKPIHSGTVVTTNVVTRFQPIVKSALARVNREIARRATSSFDDAVAKESQPIIQQTAHGEQDDSPVEMEESSSTPKRSINTTLEELALFERIKAVYEESPFSSREVFEPTVHRHVPVEIGYKDTTAYFGIYINKPSWWFIRAYIETASNKWIGFNIPPNEIKHLLPSGFNLMMPSAWAETRIPVAGIDDIEKLKPIILAVIDHEVMKHQSKEEGTVPDKADR